MQEQNEVKIQNIIKKMKLNNRKSNSHLILKAYNYAKNNHKEQKRLSGEEYIIHPVEVADILADLKMDDATISIKAADTNESIFVKKSKLQESRLKALKRNSEIYTVRDFMKKLDSK